MTIRRTERSVHDVLYDIATSYPGGIEALAPRLGTTASKLRNRLSPAVKDMEPSLKDFSLTLDYAQDANMENALEPLHALCFRHGGVFVQIEDFEHISDECIYKGVAQVMEHMGEFAGKLNAALADGEISEREMDHLDPGARRTFTVMAALWARIRGRFKRDQSKPRKPFFGKVKKNDLHDSATAD